MKRGFEDASHLEYETEEELQQMAEQMGRAAKAPRMEYQFAFKVLGPDSLVSSVLGTKGAGIQDLQNQTNTKISISSREDKFPGTANRLILVRGHDQNSVDCVLQSIVNQVKELVSSGNIKSDEDKVEMSSAKGDLKLRIVMPKAATSAMIGPKGATISRIRDSTQCRVRVEDTKIGTGELAEQIVSLLGNVESISACLTQLNQLVQELSTESYFQHWAHVRCNIDAVGGLSKGKGKGKSREGGPTLTTTVGARGMTLGKPSGGQDTSNPLFNVRRSVPNELVQGRTFAVQASLPVDSMSALIGKGGGHIKEILNQTGAKVTLRDENPNTQVTIEGPLDSVLGGYCMVMKKYLEIESSLQK